MAESSTSIYLEKPLTSAHLWHNVYISVFVSTIDNVGIKMAPQKLYSEDSESAEFNCHNLGSCHTLQWECRGRTSGSGSSLGKKEETTDYKILHKGGEEGEDAFRKRRTVNTLHSRLLRKRGLKSSGPESSDRAMDQDFSEARDRASISARGI